MFILDIIISREEIREYEKLKIISELTLIKQRLQLFESKYKCSFDEFEYNISRESEEEVTKWDDYIEWKAYHGKKQVLIIKLDQIAHVQDIRIAENI